MCARRLSGLSDAEAATLHSLAAAHGADLADAHTRYAAAADFFEQPGPRSFAGPLRATAAAFAPR